MPLPFEGGLQASQPRAWANGPAAGHLWLFPTPLGPMISTGSFLATNPLFRGRTGR